jgi:uncharacterized protein YdaT
MPWSQKNLPPAANNLTAAEKKLFVEVANERLKAGASEGSAIRQALSVAQRNAGDAGARSRAKKKD